ncbi:MAG: rhomboid family intramembrane serine protease [Candidatus Pacearchaeota archaeon]
MGSKYFRYYFLKICLILIIVFLFEIWIPGFADMFILTKSAQNGEYWRYLTAIFLHLNLLHLLFNLLGLFFFGWALEKLIGSNRFLVIFLSSGIIANLISVNFYEGSLGASGAIYGVIGCLTILRPLMFTFAFGLILPVFIAVTIWIIGDIIGTIYGSNGIGNIAHLSGIGVGIFSGILFRILMKNELKRIKKKKFYFPETLIRKWEEKYIK